MLQDTWLSWYEKDIGFGAMKVGISFLSNLAKSVTFQSKHSLTQNSTLRSLAKRQSKDRGRSYLLKCYLPEGRLNMTNWYLSP